MAPETERETFARPGMLPPLLLSTSTVRIPVEVGRGWVVADTVAEAGLWLPAASLAMT